ncbi:MAG TPA: hypothetical protein VN709_11765 [Terriglobales bacterium]|nr:hypothetical protein [Terriglobales bacterium]
MPTLVFGDGGAKSGEIRSTTGDRPSDFPALYLDLLRGGLGRCLRSVLKDENSTALDAIGARTV